MKIDGIDPVTNSQHRLQAEGARKAHAAEHGQTAKGRNSAETKVKAPNPADKARENAAQNAKQEQARAANQSDRLELRAMANSVKEEFAQAGVVPAPTRFAGVSLVSTVDIVRAGSDSAPEVTPMHKAQMIMVRQLVRRLSGKNVEVRTPSQLTAEMHTRQDHPDRAEDPARQTDQADANPWSSRVLLQTADEKVVETAMTVDTGGAAGEVDSAQPMVVEFSGQADQVPDGQFGFRVELDQAGNEPGDSIRVYAQSPGAEEKLVAVGSKDTGAVYIGHLEGKPAQTVPNQSRAPAPIGDAADPVPRLDVSL